MRKPLKSSTVQRISLIFEVQGSLFGVKNGSKIGSESHLRRGSPQKASWRPLGTLLEALGAEKTKLESLLAALGGLSRQFSPKKGPKWNPKISPAAYFLLFRVGVQIWTPISWVSKKILRLSKSIFQGCRTHFWRYRWQANKSFILQLPLWNALPPSKPRPERGGTAVSGRMAFRIRRPTLLASVPRRCARLYLLIS